VPLALFAALITGSILTFGVRRKMLSFGGIAIGFGALLLGTLVSVGVVALLWIGIRALNSDYQVLMVGTYQSGLFALALSLAAISLMAVLYWLLERRVRADNLYGGALLAWLCLTLGVSVALPEASYLMLWPLLFAVLPLAWTVLRPDHDRTAWVHLWLRAAALIPVFILLPGTYYQMIGLLNRLDYFAELSDGVAMFGLWAIFVAPMVGLYIRQLELLSSLAGPGHRWAAPAVIGLAGLVLIIYANFTSGFDVEHPRPNHIAYELNGNTGETRWVSLDHQPDAWTSQFLTNDPVAGTYELVPGTFVDALVMTAPTVPIALPSAEIMSDATLDGVRTVTFRITAPGGAAALDAVIQAQGPILNAMIDTRRVDLADYAPAGDGTLRFGYAGVSGDGIELTLSVQSDASIQLNLTETDYGLPNVPGFTVSARPADTMPASGLPLDATIVRIDLTI
jgi:hypothetical protein